MDLGTFAGAIISMGGLGLFFSGLISAANKKLHVPEDPRVSLVTDFLPGVNCGSCGAAGCANFAEHLVDGSSEISQCPVCDDSAREEIAKALGIQHAAGEREVAVVHCRATTANIKKGEYLGVQTCLGATFSHGGERACNYGCIGLGDCVAVCPFDAIKMSPEGRPVVNRKTCTGCGKCVDVCPRGIIDLNPISRRVFVLCRNKEKGKAAKSACANACIGCGLCARAVGGKGLSIINNLAEIDYEVYTKDIVLPTDKCPTRAIEIIEE